MCGEECSVPQVTFCPFSSLLSCLLTAPEDKGIWGGGVCPWPCERHVGLYMCTHSMWRWGWQQVVSNRLSWPVPALCEAEPASGVAGGCMEGRAAYGGGSPPPIAPHEGGPWGGLCLGTVGVALARLLTLGPQNSFCIFSWDPDPGGHAPLGVLRQCQNRQE